MIQLPEEVSFLQEQLTDDSVVLFTLLFTSLHYICFTVYIPNCICPTAPIFFQSTAHLVFPIYHSPYIIARVLLRSILRNHVLRTMHRFMADFP